MIVALLVGTSELPPRLIQNGNRCDDDAEAFDNTLLTVTRARNNNRAMMERNTQNGRSSTVLYGVGKLHQSGHGRVDASLLARSVTDIGGQDFQVANQFTVQALQGT